MTGKSVKDVDRYQAVLTSLLSLEENKFCADCLAKGPRWASWNLGVFICIRCAGIHRNLGVHISRVKSVNLDQWTQEQIQCVQEMGNAKARRLYEAFLPACFQRPETDQSAEVFIRDKYDKKKYVDKCLDVQALRKEKSSNSIVKEAPVVFEKMKLKRDDSQQLKPSPTKPAHITADLLNLDAPVPLTNGGPSPELTDPLDLFGSVSTTSANHAKTPPASVSMPVKHQVGSSVPENLSLFLDPAPKPEEVPRKMSKDSILSLYSTVTPHTNSMPPHGGMYVAPPHLGYAAAGFGQYQPMAQGGMMGAMMGMPVGTLAQPGLLCPAGMPAATPYAAGLPGGGMGIPGSMVGGLPSLPQQMYGVQPAQQLQWNITQMTQHMAGMNLYGANGMMGYSQPMGGGAVPGSSHMLGTHVWK
ncbi:stromal membrane-associated protein 2 [Paramormyrops kingsleyae]|uniref:Small ArfGAP2 n=1 Tax=Paramormyrops kingsleyae TaxID=1676925 RepID=A0A3B3QQQ1_9TELE|nr:stromal membrane-associated protein 2 isoform X1 [Paramormyrops kingsleyae]